MPTTAPDIVLTLAGVAVTIDVLANDSGDSLTIVGHTQPAHGSLTLEADQTFTYLPDPGFAGVDGFSYTVEDAAGATATGTVTISVLDPNEDPVAAPDAAATAAGVAVDIPLLANDSDPDEDPLTLAALGTPAHGSVSFLAPGLVRYVPQQGFSGTDRFTYTIRDGRGGSATGTVTVVVARANRPPELPARRLTVLRDTPLTFDPLEGAHDPDGDPLQLQSLGLPAHGRLRIESDGRLTYLPDAGYEGEDSFSLTVHDGHGGSATGRVEITVTRPNTPPQAAADEVTTAIDTPVSIDLLANDGDPDGDPLQLLSLGLPAHGWLAQEGGGMVTYTPAPGFSGVDSFTYTLGDDRGGHATGTVTVTVVASGVTPFANGYRYRRRILLPAEPGAAETAADFVLLLHEQGDWLRDVARGGRVESAQGFDLRFEEEDGTRLDHEIERYDPVGGELLAWVRLPSWDLAAPRAFFLYYGKPGLAAPEANPQAVWQGHLAVWDSQSGQDRSAQGRDLVATGVQAGELIGPCGLFDGSADLRIADASWLDGHAALTVQCLIAPDAAMVDSDRRILAQGPIGAANGDTGLLLRYDAVGYRGGARRIVTASLATDAGVVRFESRSDEQDTQPQLWHFVWRSGELPQLYRDGRPVAASWRGAIVNGAGQAEQPLTGTVHTVAGAPLTIGVGAGDAAHAFIGRIDVLRIRAAAPGPAAIARESAHILDPANARGLGAEEEGPDAPLSPVAAPLAAATPAGARLELDPLAASFAPAGTNVVAITPAAHGSATLVGNMIHYAPAAGFVGSDHFTYTLEHAGKRSTATVRITVQSLAQQPELPQPQRTISVASVAELEQAIAGARPGDHIVLEDGSYDFPARLAVAAQGTAEQPIVIRAAHKLGARVRQHGFALSGAHLWIWGIDFRDSASSEFCHLGGTSNRFMRCRFDMFGIAIRGRPGTRCKILFCEFTCPSKDPSSPGNRAIVLNGSDDSHTRCEIGWCYFHDMPPKTSNYHDRVRAAISTGSGNDPDGRWTWHHIHHTLLENTGDCEISVKSRGNLLEYLTGINEKSITVRMRQCGNNEARAIWQEGGPGLIIAGNDNRIIGAKIIGGVINVMAGTMSPSDAGTGMPHALRTKLAHCEGTVKVGRQWTSKYTLPARDTVIEHHTGTVQRLVEEGTSERATSDEPYYAPVRLTSAEVGVDAPWQPPLDP